MSTKAAIGIQNEDGSIHWIYQHHDGGPYGVGWSLFYRFNQEDLARALVESGGLYPAGGGGGASRDGKPYHTDKAEDTTYFYCREEYVYLWKGGQWHYHFRWQNCRQDGGTKARPVKWHRLSTIMKRDASWLRKPVPAASLSTAKAGKLFG